MLSFPYYFSSHVDIFVEFYVECLCRVFCRPFWRLLGYFFADLFAAFFVAFFVHFFGGFLPTFFRGFFAEFLNFSTLISTISGLLSYDFWGVLFRVCRFERASSVSSEASQNGVFVILQLYSFSIPGLVKVLSGLHTANLSWQTRIGRLQKVGKLVPSHVKLVEKTNTAISNMAAFLCSGTHVRQWNRKRREETESGGELERFGRSPVCPRAPPFCRFCLFLVSL